MTRPPRHASGSRSRPTAGSDARGFTLIEMVAVMVVIALLFALALPQFRARTHADLKRSALKLAATIEHVFYQSVFRHETLRLHYDLTRSSYWLDRFVDPSVESADTGTGDAGDAGGAAQASAPGASAQAGGQPEAPYYVVDHEIIPQPVYLPKGVFITSVATQYIEETTEGDAFTHFFPDGYVEPTVIYMADKGGAEYTLYASPISGKVKVLPGHHEFDVQMKEERR